MKKVIWMLMFLQSIVPVFAAGESENLWTTGKIHVVLSVLLTILGLIFIFLIVLERKISKLEKDTPK